MATWAPIAHPSPPPGGCCEATLRESARARQPHSIGWESQGLRPGRVWVGLGARAPQAQADEGTDRRGAVPRRALGIPPTLPGFVGGQGRLHHSRTRICETGEDGGRPPFPRRDICVMIRGAGERGAGARGHREGVRAGMGWRGGAPPPWEAPVACYGCGVRGAEAWWDAVCDSRIVGVVRYAERRVRLAGCVRGHT